MRLRSPGLCVAHCRACWKGGGPYCLSLSLVSIYSCPANSISGGRVLVREEGRRLCVLTFAPGDGLEGGLCEAER